MAWTNLTLIEEFIHFGFWGLGLILLLMAGFFAHVVLTVISIIWQEFCDNLKKYTLLILGVSVLTVIVFLIIGWIEMPITTDVIWNMPVILFWVFYFLFVPRIIPYLLALLTSKIKLDKKYMIIQKIIHIFVKYVLVYILFYMLIQLHIYVGGKILHITPD